MRFGSLRGAYKLIGYQPKRNFKYIDTRLSVNATVTELVTEIVTRIESAGGNADFDRATDALTINNRLTFLSALLDVGALPAKHRSGLLRVVSICPRT